MLTQLRGDCLTHAVVENTDTINPVQRAAILRLFGLPEHHAVTLDAKHLGSPFPRARMFLSTLPPPDDLTNGRSHSAATQAAWDTAQQLWARGWAPRRDGCCPTMLRSRDPSRPKASTYQYAPQHLVYQLEGPPHWHEGSLATLRTKILSLMPPDVRTSYHSLLADDRGNEDAAQTAVNWIDRHGPAAGLWTPNTTERMRAIGPAAYLQSLKLSEVQLYNMTGNHFDPRALGHRLLQPLFALTQLQNPKQHAFPSLADAIHLFGEKRARLVADHGTKDFPLEVTPFPVDLLPALQATPRTLG